jgi:hypothetical protein
LLRVLPKGLFAEAQTAEQAQASAEASTSGG